MNNKTVKESYTKYWIIPLAFSCILSCAKFDDKRVPTHRLVFCGVLDPTANLDIDGDGITASATDGQLILRFMFGTRGTALVDGAMGLNATRTAQEIETLLHLHASILDIDGSGSPDALTDGILIMRYILGWRGSELVDGAVDPQGARVSAPAIEQYLSCLVSNPTANLDIDGDGITASATDGQLILRFMFGTRGTALVDGAMGLNATRTAQEIETYLHLLASVLDIDNSGSHDALTDGILIMRYILGWRGSELVDGAVDPQGTRVSAPAIEQYLSFLVSNPTANLDIDGDGITASATDGQLILRFMFGTRGTALVDGAMGLNATRTAQEIETYLHLLASVLDIDNSGSHDALTDGILIMRYILGWRGSELVDGAVDPQGTRVSAPAIEQYLSFLVSNPTANLDIDGDGITASATDGQLILRFMFGTRGTALVDGAMGLNATRTAQEIETYLHLLASVLDIDNSGSHDALTDGILIMRYILGWRGSELVDGAVDPQGTRVSAPAIEQYLSFLVSNPAADNQP